MVGGAKGLTGDGSAGEEISIEYVRTIVADLVDLLAGLLGDGVANNGGDLVTLEEKEGEVLRALDGEVAETVGVDVTVAAVGTVANTGKAGVATELTTAPGIDTAGLAPRGVHALEAVRLVTGELGGGLADHLHALTTVVGRLGGHSANKAMANEWALTQRMSCS